MAQRRHLRRNLLVFLSSLAFHVGLFFIAASEFQFYPHPRIPEEAVQVELVAPPETVPPMPPIQLPPKPQIVPQPTPPQPQPQLRPQPQPSPARPTPAPTAPLQQAPNPTPAPAPKAAEAPSPLAPPIPAPQPGPPQAVPESAVTKAPPRVITARPLILHKNQQQGTSLAPPVSIPGAVFAPAPGAVSAGGGAQGAPGGGAAAAGASALPGGAMPGFGRGLRGGALGCMNAQAVKLTAAEQQRCDAVYGMGTQDAPQMDRIDSSKRAVFDREAAQETTASKYRDSMPSQSDVTPEAAQPHARNGYKAPGQ